MNYKLIKASKEDLEILKEFKLRTIFDYAENLSNEETQKIINYVESSTLNLLKKYKLITLDNQIIGTLLFYRDKNGYFLDELYLKSEYRNKKIGTNILMDILNKHESVCLWVYKKNQKAINLYKRLNFNIEKETKTRYFMKFNKETN